MQSPSKDLSSSIHPRHSFLLKIESPFILKEHSYPLSHDPYLRKVERPRLSDEAPPRFLDKSDDTDDDDHPVEGTPHGPKAKAG